jgi:hypothetical protein
MPFLDIGDCFMCTGILGVRYGDELDYHIVGITLVYLTYWLSGSDIWDVKELSGLLFNVSRLSGRCCHCSQLLYSATNKI